jgi:hypothetical protein
MVDAVTGSGKSRLLPTGAQLYHLSKLLYLNSGSIEIKIMQKNNACQSRMESAIEKAPCDVRPSLTETSITSPQVDQGSQTGLDLIMSEYILGYIRRRRIIEYYDIPTSVDLVSAGSGQMQREGRAGRGKCGCTTRFVNGVLESRTLSRPMPLDAVKYYRRIQADRLTSGSGPQENIERGRQRMSRSSRSEEDLWMDMLKGMYITLL